MWEKGGLQKRQATLQKKQKIEQLLAGDRRHEHWYERWQMPARPNKKKGLKVEKALPCNCDDNSDFEDTLGSFCNSDPNLGFVETKAQIGGSTTETGGVKPARAIENIDINNGYLQLTTDETPRKIVAQISLEAIKREMNQQ